MAARARRSSSPPRTPRASPWPCRARWPRAATRPTTLDTTAEVTFQPGTGITGIVLKVVGDVPGLTAEQFQEAAEGAKGCPVSQALAAVPISLEARLA